MSDTALLGEQEKDEEEERRKRIIIIIVITIKIIDDCAAVFQRFCFISQFRGPKVLVLCCSRWTKSQGRDSALCVGVSVSLDM